MSVPSIPPEPQASSGDGRRAVSGETLSVGTFVVLGTGDAMIGTAWPSIRHSFHAAVGDLGLVLLTATAGVVLTSAVTGRFLTRHGSRRLLAVAAATGAAGALGISVSRSLAELLACSAVLGCASGLIDSGLNAVVGVTGRRRLLNLLHGAYSAGTSFGPLVVTAAVILATWRSAYAALVCVYVLTALIWLRTPASRSQVRRHAPESRDAPAPVPRLQGGRPRLALVSGLFVFFVYAGLEIGAGQWDATFCRDHLGLTPVATGLAVFAYWGAICAVRLLLAVPRRPPPSQALVVAGGVVALVGSAGIWWDPGPAVVIFAFVLLAVALAGIFPALIALTPGRVAESRAAHVIAWQIAASSLGGAACSALIGLVLDTAGVAQLGPCLFVLAVIFLFANALLTRLTAVPLGAAAGHGEG